jgi:hypothetical protein
MNNLDQELDKLLYRLMAAHQIAYNEIDPHNYEKHPNNDGMGKVVARRSEIESEAKQAIQSIITTQKQEAYIQGYNDNARDCYCDSKKAIESLIPHHHLMDDGESHDIRPNIKSIITTKREEIDG